MLMWPSAFWHPCFKISVNSESSIHPSLLSSIEEEPPSLLRTIFPSRYQEKTQEGTGEHANSTGGACWTSSAETSSFECFHRKLHLVGFRVCGKHNSWDPGRNRLRDVPLLSRVAFPPTDHTLIPAHRNEQKLMLCRNPHQWKNPIGFRLPPCYSTFSWLWAVNTHSLKRCVAGSMMVLLQNLLDDLSTFWVVKGPMCQKENAWTVPKIPRTRVLSGLRPPL